MTRLRYLRYLPGYLLLHLMRSVARWWPRLPVPQWVPFVGRVDGHVWAPPVAVRGPMGSSMTIPAILQIKIDGTRGATFPPVLRPVAERLFPGYAPFHFNVSFACGKARTFRPGVYADPRSPWFNVFLGYYQIDVERTHWERPFGYEAAAGGRFQPRMEDLRRLGDADWNYFSNYLYGVPLDAVEKNDGPNGTLTHQGRTQIGVRHWDEIGLANMEVASAYVSCGDRRGLSETSILSDLWRCVFGLPYRGNKDDPPESFFATPLDGLLYSCYRETSTHYQTFIFGGTINRFWDRGDGEKAAANRDFLALQMTTIRALIADRFPGLGFADAGVAADVSRPIHTPPAVVEPELRT